MHFVNSATLKVSKVLRLILPGNKSTFHSLTFILCINSEEKCKHCNISNRPVTIRKCDGRPNEVATHCNYVYN